MQDCVNYITLKWSDFSQFPKTTASEWSRMSHGLRNSRHFAKCPAAPGSEFFKMIHSNSDS